MFKPVGAKNYEEYIAMLPDERRQIIEQLDKLIRETAPEVQRWFAYNMLGYGKFEYTNYKKQKVDWPVVALASQKNYISLYVCSLDNGEYLAEKYADKLGKVSVGKSCIRFKKLEDLNIETVREVIKTAFKNPGLVS